MSLFKIYPYGGLLSLFLMICSVIKGHNIIYFWQLLPVLSISVNICFFLVGIYIINAITSSNNELIKLWSLMKKLCFKYFCKQCYIGIPIYLIIMIGLYFTHSFYGIINYLIGVLSTMIVGFIGIYVSSRCNLSVCSISNNTHNIFKTFRMGIIGGAVISLGLVVNLLSIFCCISNFPVLLTSSWLIPFGSISCGLLTKISGGLFTKGADIGSDLVGKMEKNIPEDDKRNPGVIADNMGDLVGDCIGSGQLIMGLISMIFYLPGFSQSFVLPMILILSIASFSSLSSFFLLINKNININKSIVCSFFLNVLLILLSINLCCSFININIIGFIAGIVMAIVVCLSMVMLTSKFDSSFSYLKKLIELSDLGPSFNILGGISLGYKAVCFTLFLSFAVFISLFFCGKFNFLSFDMFIGIISLSPFMLMIDNFGPIIDNSGGLVEMCCNDNKSREVTDYLDVIGNSTKAITKIFSFISFIPIIFSCFFSEVLLNYISLVFYMAGAGIVYFFGSYLINILLDITTDVIKILRDVFKDKNILSHQKEPDYLFVISSLIDRVMSKSVMPVLLLMVFIFVIVGSVHIVLDKLFFDLFGTWIAEDLTINFNNNLNAIISVFKVAIMFHGLNIGIKTSISGGAWDNCKKNIEAQKLKGTELHRSSVIGDMVGDCFKDVIGPIMAPLILFSMLFIDYSKILVSMLLGL